MTIIRIGNYDIELEEGKAPKRLDLLTREEFDALAQRITKKVLEKCRKYGTTPVVGNSKDRFL